MKKLFIVESPSKAKTISKYLGKEYKVLASSGHVADLPSSHMGVDLQKNFEPEWVILKGKKKFIQLLESELQNVKEIYLATDPDREGEAIAYHIHRLLPPNQKTYYRIRLKEITKEAIQNSLLELDSINLKLVESQTTRRILDRITGYSFSPILWKYGKNLSAGRVQSPVLRWICEREQEILQFQKENVYSLIGNFSDLNNKQSLEATYQNKEKKKDIKYQELAPLLNRLTITNEFNLSSMKPGKSISFPPSPNSFRATDLKQYTKKEYPPPPFVTSSLQKMAYIAFKFSPTKTMKLAQNLYEGTNASKGLITYLRTDSTRISPVAIREATAYLSKITSIPINPLFRTKGKLGTMDAHEAIRPTDLNDSHLLTNLSADERKLYDLIKQRYLTSFLAPHEKQILTGLLTDGTDEFVFRLENSLQNGFKDFARIPVRNQVFPSWKQGTLIQNLDLKLECRETHPPSRFRESGIVDKMEKTGIGRPSTFAATLETLYKRKYILQKNGELFPTPLGETVNQEITARFSELVSDAFSSQMEKELDQIATGKADKTSFLHKIYQKIQSSLREKKKPIEEKSCPLCKEGILRKKISREKKIYYLCSKFPYCEHAEYL
jgi:DNA topoisomerase I